MEKIDFKKQNIPFTQVANGVLNDPELSLEAKGLYAYLYSKPEGWQFSSLRMMKESRNGRDSIRKTLNELVTKGYLLRFKLADGRMVYKIVFPPIDPEPENQSLAKNPEPEKATDGNTHRRETSPISNKEGLVINKISNKEGEQSSQPINLIIDLFKEVNPTYQLLFKQKPQRDAVSRMLSAWGQEKLENTIKSLPGIIYQKYAPVVTTPVQLERNIGKLVAFYKQENSKKVQFII